MKKKQRDGLIYAFKKNIKSRFSPSSKRLRGTKKERRKAQQLVRLATKNFILSHHNKFISFNWFRKLVSLPSLTMISFLIFLGLIAYYLFYPYNLIDMTLNDNGKIPVVEKQIQPGQSITLLMEFDKSYECSPHIDWYLVDGFVLLLADGGIARPTGFNVLARTVKIPDTAPQTRVHLRIEYSCQINPLRTINYSWDTEEFEIL